ncbi:MAG: hypothetical protein K9G30_06495 [Parvibaculum sp.]|nr:hypothetical protein [Parvibaculum sp.]
MDKDQLLAILSAESARLGGGTVAESQFESWVTKGLVPRAKAHGRQRGLNPLWSYSDEAVEMAKTIVAAKAGGVSRTTALKVRLWLRGFDFPPEQVREALLEEFSRLMKRQRRRGEFDYDHRSNTDPTERQKKVLPRRMGDLDPRLQNEGMKLSEDVFLTFTSIAHWGTDTEGTSNGSEPLDDVLSSLVNGVLGGLWGDPDSTDRNGESLIEKADQEDLENARKFVQALQDEPKLIEMGFGGFQQQADSNTDLVRTLHSTFRSFDWEIPLVVMGLNINLNFSQLSKLFSSNL